MKFWKYGRVALALIGAIVLGLSITCCGVYTSGYLYVTGAQYGQIGAFKVDHDFGYLTPVTGQPFASSGSDPVQEVVLPGGRFLATVNKGSNNVSMYTIGGAGTLYYQASYSTSGSNPVSLVTNSAGNFLFVVDQNAPPDINSAGVDINAGRGDITVFAIDSTTGKLTLVTNQNTFNTSGTQLPYFAVNYKPVQAITTSSYLYILDQAYVPGSSTGVPAACASQPVGSPCTTPDVFLYAINATNGQLTLTQNAPLNINGAVGGDLSTIYTNAKYVYIADVSTECPGSNQPGSCPTGSILPFSVNTSSGVLQALVGGTVPNVPNASSHPDAFFSNSTSQFLYVANYGPNANPNLANSNISPFTIDPTTGQLTAIPASPLGAYPTGSGPIWMTGDSTNQYIYTANFNDNTISALVIDATHGQLSNIIKGTVQTPTVGQPTYVVVTGRTF